jgi:hypothetical protein
LISIRLVVWVALVVAWVALGVPSPAPAAGWHPKGDYAPFAGCPLSNSKTGVCIFAQTEGGALAIGSRRIPLARTMTLQGGVHEDEASGEQEFIPSEGGETLSRTPQAIPGTHFTVTAPKSLPVFVQKIFDEFINQKPTDVTATTELAGPASSIGIDTQNLIEAKGIGLSLPVKVKLSNPLLGEGCYIGSDANPISIPLTTGSTKLTASHEAATGKPGHAQFKDEYNLVTIKEDSLLNDSFMAPRAAGCGGILSFLVDPAVNAELGLPLAAGHNEAILNVTLRDANAPAVKASE